ncbi:toxin VasX [Enterobacteriaceae bacterium TYF_5]
MTEHVSSDVLTPEEKHLRKMVEAVNQAAPRNLPADAVICPCENEHRPVYPVRYAYSNLSGDKNAVAAMPPEVKKLLELCPAQPDIEVYEPEVCTLEDTKGFSARLLRSGWVYVFEEGEFPTRTDTRGQLLIFKHTITYTHNGQVYDENDNSAEAEKAVTGGDADEYFIPYIRVYDTESLTGELKEQFPHYPYLAIKKDVIRARFFFSDIPLPDYTLNKLTADPAFRASFMQEINLVDFNDNPYALELHEEHIDYLVEEYKEESHRFAAFAKQAKEIGSDLPKGHYFAEITNTPDVSKGSETLLAQVKASLDENEKSSLVILHDPVGYQKDVLAFYSFVTAMYAAFQHHWRYPNQIGHYLSTIKMHLDHPDIAQTGAGHRLNEQFLDNIDMQGWQTYWPEIESGYKKFEQIQQNIAHLYGDFLTNPAITDKIGGIKNYTDHVFLIREQYAQTDFWHLAFFEEVRRYSEFHEQLLSPLKSSASGQQVLSLMFSVDKPEGKLWKNLCDIAVNLLSEEELRKGGMNFFKEKMLPSLESVLLIGWDALGYAFTETHALLKKNIGRSRHITQAGIDFLAGKVLPAFLGFFDLRVNTKTLQPMSGKQFMGWMDSLNGKAAPLKNTVGQMRTLLNWDEKLRSPAVTHAINTVQYHYASTGLPVDKETFKNTLKLSLSLYSLLTGILELQAANKMSDYDKNNPLNTGAVNILRTQIVVNLVKTTEGIIKTRQAAGLYMKRVTYPPLRHILMKIHLPEPKSVWAKRTVKSLGYLVALLGAALPIAECMAELDKKNHVTAGAKFTEAVATLALSIGVAGVGQANAIIEGAAVLSTNPIIRFATLYAWEIVLIATAALIGSAIIYYIFETDDFDELLKNCFWGNGDKYFAGGYLTKDNDDIDRPIDRYDQLNKYIKNFEKYTAYYQMELQEFLNFFFTPQVKITAQPQAKAGQLPTTYVIHYQFRLANFQCGLSDIEYQLVKLKKTVMYASQMPVKYLPPKPDIILRRKGFEYIASDNHIFNQAFDLAFEQALMTALQNTSLRAGEFKFSFKVDAGTHSGDPLKNNSVPSVHWYYLTDRIKGDIAPLRYRKGNLQDKIYGYIDDKGME